jgi:hypothetical protein
VLIITISYFVAYDPMDDPFSKPQTGGQANPTPSQHEANPVDVIMLNMIKRRLFTRQVVGREQVAGQPDISTASRSRLKQACSKVCITCRYILSEHGRFY